MAQPTTLRQILLADDDKDDIFLFKDAIGQLMVPNMLAAVQDGEQLMELLNRPDALPDILFLDLNMPKKKGIDCLLAVKESQRLRYIPVIIISTSCEARVVNQLYDAGAQYYICKPNDFAALTRVIGKALRLTSTIDLSQPPRDKFVLSH